MARSGGLTLEQVKAIVEDEDLERADLAEVLAESFGVQLPDNLHGDELAEFVYETYQKKASEIDTERKASKEVRGSRKKRRASSPPSEGQPQSSQDGDTSRTSFLVGLIKRNGMTTRKNLEEALDEAFHYTEAGKSPRTRVNRVLRNLKEAGQITLDGGRVTWVEKQ